MTSLSQEFFCGHKPTVLVQRIKKIQRNYNEAVCWMCRDWLYRWL